jgi:hypothetical protein
MICERGLLCFWPQRSRFITSTSLSCVSAWWKASRNVFEGFFALDPTILCGNYKRSCVFGMPIEWFALNKNDVERVNK